jgi:hypothetical protein
MACRKQKDSFEASAAFWRSDPHEEQMHTTECQRAAGKKGGDNSQEMLAITILDRVLV